MKIGIGYDIHRLVEGRPLILGGVSVPYKKGLLGHSDADVLLHAISDAVLGAANLGDIGIHFPPGDPKYKDISSKEILKKVQRLTGDKGYRVNNVDAILVAEEPKIAPISEGMRKNISDILNIDVTQVSVKGKTNQGIGEIGRGEAIAAHAVVTLDG